MVGDSKAPPFWQEATLCANGVNAGSRLGLSYPNGIRDGNLNDRALVNGSRLLSVYTLANGLKVWILTEGDRSSTTVLLPEEY